MRFPFIVKVVSLVDLLLGAVIFTSSSMSDERGVGDCCEGGELKTGDAVVVGVADDETAVAERKLFLARGMAEYLGALSLEEHADSQRTSWFQTKGFLATMLIGRVKTR